MESVGSTKLVRRGVLKLHLQLLQAGAAPRRQQPLLQLHLRKSSMVLTLATTSSTSLASFASPHLTDVTMIIRPQYTAETSLENVPTPPLDSSAWTLAGPAAPGQSTCKRQKEGKLTFSS
jgi:hypothetical protein